MFLALAITFFVLVTIILHSMLVVLGCTFDEIILKELLILFGGEDGFDFCQILAASGFSVLTGLGVAFARRFFEIFDCLFLGVVKVESCKGAGALALGLLAIAGGLAFGLGRTRGGSGILSRGVDGYECYNSGCNANNFLFHILIGFVNVVLFCVLFGSMTAQAQIGLIRACGFNFYS